MNRKLMDDYEDALIALLMDSYSEEEGKQLILQAKDLEECGGYTFSDDFESRLQRACQSAKKNKRRNRNAKTIKRMVTHAAVMIVMLGFVSSFLFITVQAFRAKVYDLFIKQEEQAVIITMEQDDLNEPYGENNTTAYDEVLYPTWYPPEFSAKVLSSKREGFYAIYLNKNDEQQYIEFCSSSPSASIALDNEDAQRFELIDILNHSGLVIEKDGIVTVFWQDQERLLQYRLISNSCDLDDLLKMAESMYY